MQQQMECRDEETLELKETYSSLQQEVDIKTKKLKKVATTELMRRTFDKMHVVKPRSYWENVFVILPGNWSFWTSIFSSMVRDTKISRLKFKSGL